MTSYNGRTLNENGDSPPFDSVVCDRCDSACDIEDNFCRSCGYSLHDSPNLPSVREHQLPAVHAPSVPATVVKGAAFVAAGKLAEMLVRRMVRGAFGGSSRKAKPPAKRAKAEIVPREGQLPDEGQVVSETFLLRRVRIRR